MASTTASTKDLPTQQQASSESTKIYQSNNIPDVPGPHDRATNIPPSAPSAPSSSVVEPNEPHLPSSFSLARSSLHTTLTTSSDDTTTSHGTVDQRDAYHDRDRSTQEPRRSKSITFARSVSEGMPGTTRGGVAGRRGISEEDLVSSADETTAIVGRERGGARPAYSGQGQNGQSVTVGDGAGEEGLGAMAEQGDEGARREWQSREGRSDGMLGVGGEGLKKRDKWFKNGKGFQKPTSNNTLVNGDGAGDTEEERQENQGLIKGIWGKLKSIELDNKGSVARDHLALGTSIFILPPNQPAISHLPHIPYPKTKNKNKNKNILR